ncbi:hypothetical protein BDV06DRAFT_15991 [Aspergillus oleicola]
MSTPKEQPFYVGMTGFVYGCGCILGPIVGGSLAGSSATWNGHSISTSSSSEPCLQYIYSLSHRSPVALRLLSLLNCVPSTG